MGSADVGKTCLANSFVQNIFIDKYDPTIEDCYVKKIEIDGEQCQLEILDTAGTDLSAMRDIYINNREGFILVYCITSQATYNDVMELKDRIYHIKKTINVPMVIVGTKSDLDDERVVGKESGQQLAKKYQCTFLEASSKMNINVNEIFFDLVRQMNRQRFPLGQQLPAFTRDDACKMKKTSTCNIT
ncbi:unnamed protein product [Didymodactylos carnosus]|uniref:Uncharacterized protein n=1 Tax=Didymodactylos carnosus TaxID=1234261 RepID=A0A8S2FHN3_9BILA|nr:unnamed protein product [Didymodactylos carnosus]CAF4260121.1 unnamed protein product [Didymodactylos carnosus]